MSVKFVARAFLPGPDWRQDFLPLAAALLVICATRAARADEPLHFNRDIRPILSDKCFHCHGPDANKREADLRLDVREDAVAGGDIEPGQPERSEVMKRLLSTRPKTHMPPAKAKVGDLTPAEVEKIRRWIAEGATYEAHWSFLPVAPPATPGFDELVEHGLAARGLAFQPEADRSTLLRRVSFDLTGLPPTSEELAAFTADASPAAYERVVERLLASPRYGERMAVDWLDVARYADSYGFQVDRERSVWPWRDWVVRAFNENLPFDQFITWQVAGDLLPHPTPDQLLATAFNRLHQQESEGGSVEEEYRVEYVCDRLQTFATAFLGLTFECARCHDHKFDPILQKDYYGLFSLFQNIDEAGLYSFFTDAVPTPALTLGDPGALAARQQAVARQEEALAAAPEPAGFAAWLAARPATLALPGEIARFDFDHADRQQLVNRLAPARPARLTGDNQLVPGHTGQALQFSGDDAVELPLGNFERHQPFTIALWLRTPDVKERAVVLHRSKAWTDAGSRGYELLLEEGRLKWSLIHFWPGNAISIRARAPVTPGAWTHVVVSHDGSSRADGLRLYVNGRPAEVEVIEDALTRDLTGGGGDDLALGARFRDRGFKGGAIDDLRIFGRELTPLEALATADEPAALQLLADGGPDVLRPYYLAIASPAHAAQLAALEQARAEAGRARNALPEIMTMHELAAPKPAWVLFRGQYDQRRAPVAAGLPAFLPPWPAGAPHNRLGLARWLTAPEHPLTARVLVNRFWQGVFGRGLVKTPGDFGSQGAPPVYPEVLDWLAARFVASGWDTKALLKTIVLSRTYRQRSLAPPQLMADDPENDWLARGPRFRLPAEMIRDGALAAAGLLSDRMGGPSVDPYEMSEAFKPAQPSAGDGVYRRSLYTEWRRTAPPPAMIAFDAPRRAVCTARRERTETPLQALVLLNGVQFVEAARVLGAKLHQDNGGAVHAMIEQGCRRCLSRAPDAREQEILTQLYAEQLAHFQAQPAEAAALLQVGRAPPAPGLAAPEAAAAAILAQVLLNHDLSVVKR